MARQPLAPADGAPYLGDYDGPAPDSAADDRDLLWPDAASVASWPELSSQPHDAAAPPVPHKLRSVAEHGVLRPSVLELQRLSAAEGVGRHHASTSNTAATLVSMRRRRAGSGAGGGYGSLGRSGAAFALAAVMVACAGSYGYAAWQRRPWPPVFGDAEWSGVWLFAAIVDIAGARACFCAIVLSSGHKCRSTGLWVALCVTLGTPAIALYLVLRLLSHGSLRLTSVPGARASSSSSPGSSWWDALVERQWPG